VKCPGCGRKVEFFKDEPKIKCRGCGRMVANPKIDLGCAEWCQYSEQCLGVSVGKDVAVLRDKLIEEMKQVFGQDRRRIEHALSVLDYAEQIQAAEGGHPLVVKAAAILHDIGILEAERGIARHDIEPPRLGAGLRVIGCDIAARAVIAAAVANDDLAFDDTRRTGDRIVLIVGCGLDDPFDATGLGIPQERPRYAAGQNVSAIGRVGAAAQVPKAVVLRRPCDCGLGERGSGKAKDNGEQAEH